MSSTLRVSCDLCPRSFANEDQLSQHKRDSHKIQTSPEKPRESLKLQDKSTGRLKCDQCNRLFDSNDSLQQHKESKHQEKGATSTCNSEPTSSSIRDLETDMKSLRLNVGASVSISLKATVNQVLERALPKDPDVPQNIYPCDLCKKIYPTAAQLEQHTTAKHGAPNVVAAPNEADRSTECPVCSRSFPTVAQREQHVASTGHSLSATDSRSNMTSDTEKSFNCSTCGRKFHGLTQLQQHLSATGHQAMERIEDNGGSGAGASPSEGSSSNKSLCKICSRSFSTIESLQQHHRASHESAPFFEGQVQQATRERENENPADGLSLSPMKPPCKKCHRSFSTTQSLQQHEETSHAEVGEKDLLEAMKGSTVEEYEMPVPNKFPCSACKRSFTSEMSLKQHEQASHGDLSFQSGLLNTIRNTTEVNPELGRSTSARQDRLEKKFRCPKCTKEFDTQAFLQQHQQAASHLLKKESKKRETYIRSMLTQGSVREDDRKESVAVVKQVVDKIMACVRKQDGGKIYLPDVRKAGSTAVNTKIGKADEFDTNIPLNINMKNIRTEGTINYAYEDKIIESEEGPSFKNMNIERRIVDTQHYQREIPRGQAVVSMDLADSKVPGHLLHNGDLIPHKVLQDLYRKVNEAKRQLNLEEVYLNREAHGPALTLTITRPRKHNIHVDMTVSLPCDEFIKVTDAGWPRRETMEAYTQEQISACVRSGMHLVPKGDETWSISYSKAERGLLESIDAGNCCRRQVQQYLKRQIQIFKSRSNDGLPGISSHLVKQQVLWSSEQRRDPDYWHMRNVETCVLDTMGDFVDSLRRKIIPYYFDTKNNILAKKKPDVLRRLEEYFAIERQTLLDM